MALRSMYVAIKGLRTLDLRSKFAAQLLGFVLV